MKKVLGLMSLMVLGLGLVVWAVAPLSGDWSATLTLDPSALTFATYIDLDSDFTLEYAISDWTFTSTSGFSSDGWDGQSFAAEGLLGAFSFSATMNFLPYALISTAEVVSYANGTLYFDNGILPIDSSAAGNVLPVALISAEAVTATTSTYGVAFDDLTVTGGVSIAGVSFSAEFFMEHWEGSAATAVEPVYWYEVRVEPDVPDVWLTDNTYTPAIAWMVQSGSVTTTTPADTVVGAGWLFTAAGSFGDVTLTSYTYFNLDPTDMVELDISSSFSFDLTDYTIDKADQVVRFSHEVLVLEGLSLGCIEAEAYLWISCDHGFENLLLLFENIPVICCGITTDFAINYSLQNKQVELYPSIAGDWLCWTPTVSLNWDGTSIIDGISLDAIEVEVALNGITFSSKTTFGSFMGTIDSGNTTDYYFVIPTIATNVPVPAVLTNNDGFYVIDKVEIANDYYKTFEYFKIEVDGDSCCGGAFDVTVQTWFGQHYTADLGEYGYWYETNVNDAGTAAAAFDHGQGFYFVNGAAPITYLYDNANDATNWRPHIGNVPVNVIDVAYGALLGLDGIPVVYTTTASETLTTDSKTEETATAGRLFEWAKTSVDTSIGVGANFTLTFGLDIDAYGWDSLDVGFEYTF